MQQSRQELSSQEHFDKDGTVGSGHVKLRHTIGLLFCQSQHQNVLRGNFGVEFLVRGAKVFVGPEVS